VSRRTRVHHAAQLATALALFAGAADAHGAGLSRPNVVGARAIGMGGAYTAVADDPTAVWYNPAGTAVYGDNVGYVGGELIFTGRSYTPDAQSVLGKAGLTSKISENTAPTLIPVLGFTTRFGFGRNAPARFAFSIAAYDAYGGSIAFNPNSLTANGKAIGITSSKILQYEVAPTLAYQVNDRLSVGASLRIGINTFSVNDTENVFSANLSGTGVGVGATLGAMVKLHRMVQVGLVYRTPMSVAISGTSPVALGSNAPTQQDFGVHMHWPQSAGAGVAVTPHERIMVSAQADWTGWSSLQKLDLTVAGLPQPKEMRYMDSYSVHLGLQGVITRFLLLRFGLAYDSNAIPDRTVRRENEDAQKATIAGGFGLKFWKIFIDGAFEAFLPLAARTVSTPTPAASPENETGRYSATVYSAELSAQIRF
jgi:long-chain fatty acid transport protein